MLNVGGYLPLSLSDYPGKVASVVFLQGCNWRCGFCHNGDLLKAGVCRGFSEGFVFDKIRIGAKALQGIVISGGEPTCQDGLEGFITSIKSEFSGLLVKLDTNGTNPKVIKNLVDEKLVDFISMDIKTSKNKYEKLTRAREFVYRDIEESVDILKGSGVEYELRTTVVPGFFDKEDREEIKGVVNGVKKYILQSFDSHHVLDKRFSLLKGVNESFLTEYKSNFANCQVR